MRHIKEMDGWITISELESVYQVCFLFFWSSASAECRSSRKRRCLITPAKNSLLHVLFQSLTQFYVSNEQIVDLILSHHGCATPHALWRWPSDASSIDVIGRWRGGMFFFCCRREFRTDRSRKSILSRSIVLYWLNTGVIWSVQPRLFLFSSLSISRLRPVSSDTRAYVRLLLCSTASWSGHHFMNRHDLDGNHSRSGTYSQFVVALYKQTTTNDLLYSFFSDDYQNLCYYWCDILATFA